VSASFAYDVAHLVGGGVLLASFLLLYQRRVAALIGVLAVQGALVALAALWQGHVRGEAHLFATAAIAFAAKAVLVPLLLRRIIARLGLDRAVEASLPVGASLAAGVALVVLAVLVVLPATAGSAGALARVDMAIALSVLLLGVLMMATRRTAIPQVVGLIAVENGLLLGAVAIAGLPVLLELSIAALVLVLVLVGGVFSVLMRARIDSLDVTLLGRHRGEGGG
jgi:hydrogenase-4 component E